MGTASIYAQVAHQRRASLLAVARQELHTKQYSPRPVAATSMSLEQLSTTNEKGGNDDLSQSLHYELESSNAMAKVVALTPKEPRAARKSTQYNNKQQQQQKRNQASSSDKAMAKAIADHVVSQLLDHPKLQMKHAKQEAQAAEMARSVQPLRDNPTPKRQDIGSPKRLHTQAFPDFAELEPGFLSGEKEAP